MCFPIFCRSHLKRREQRARGDADGGASGPPRRLSGATMHASGFGEFGTRTKRKVEVIDADGSRSWRSRSTEELMDAASEFKAQGHLPEGDERPNASAFSATDDRGKPRPRATPGTTVVDHRDLICDKPHPSRPPQERLYRRRQAHRGRLHRPDRRAPDAIS